MAKKNDYSISFYNEQQRVLFLEYVHIPKVAFDWIKNKNIAWTHANMYDRRSREFLKQFKPDDLSF